jgi:hypothetical protein
MAMPLSRAQGHLFHNKTQNPKRKSDPKLNPKP